LSKRLIITVHGIRTYGDWQERLETLTKNLAHEHVDFRHYKYGYFSIFAFVFPLTRWLVTSKFRQELKRQIASDWERIDLVGHSFGTHIISWAVKGLSNNDTKIDTILLAGSVLKSNFPWQELLDTKVKRVVNDCGTKDAILLLSQFGVLLTGMAGRVGFTGMTGVQLRNRFFPFTHSEYFDNENSFMEKHWIPLLFEDAPATAIDHRENTTVSSIFNWLIYNIEPIKILVWFTPFIYFSYWITDLYYEADKQREVADEQRKAADKQREVADEQRKAADEQRIRAEKSEEIALEERERAIRALRTAEEQKEIATQQRQIATDQTEVAEQERLVAESNLLRALTREDSTLQLAELDTRLSTYRLSNKNEVKEIFSNFLSHEPEKGIKNLDKYLKSDAYQYDTEFSPRISKVLKQLALTWGASFYRYDDLAANFTKERFIWNDSIHIKSHDGVVNLGSFFLRPAGQLTNEVFVATDRQSNLYFFNENYTNQYSYSFSGVSIESLYQIGKENWLLVTHRDHAASYGAMTPGVTLMNYKNGNAISAPLIMPSLEGADIWANSNCSKLMVRDGGSLVDLIDLSNSSIQTISEQEGVEFSKEHSENCGIKKIDDGGLISERQGLSVLHFPKRKTMFVNNSSDPVNSIAEDFPTYVELTDREIFDKVKNSEQGSLGFEEIEPSYMESLLDPDKYVTEEEMAFTEMNLYYGRSNHFFKYDDSLFAFILENYGKYSPVTLCKISEAWKIEECTLIDRINFKSSSRSERYIALADIDYQNGASLKIFDLKSFEEINVDEYPKEFYDIEIIGNLVYGISDTDVWVYELEGSEIRLKDKIPIPASQRYSIPPDSYEQFGSIIAFNNSLIASMRNNRAFSIDLRNNSIKWEIYDLGLRSDDLDGGISFFSQEKLLEQGLIGCVSNLGTKFILIEADIGLPISAQMTIPDEDESTEDYLLNFLENNTLSSINQLNQQFSSYSHKTDTYELPNSKSIKPSKRPILLNITNVDDYE